MTNAELIIELKYHASIERRKLLSDAADALEAAEQRIKELESQAAFFDAEKLNYKENIEYRDERIKELEAKMPKQGEWIEDDSTYCGADRANYKCSLCGKIGGTWRRGLKQDELPPFCGSCGARMRGANDEQIH